MRMFLTALMLIVALPVSYLIGRDIYDWWGRRHEEPKEKHDEPEA